MTGEHLDRLSGYLQDLRMVVRGLLTVSGPSAANYFPTRTPLSMPVLAAGPVQVPAPPSRAKVGHLCSPPVCGPPGDNWWLAATVCFSCLAND